MRFVLENKNAVQFEIDDRFKPKISPYKRRSRVSDRFAGDGGIILGDEHVDARDIDFIFHIAVENHGGNDAEYFDQWNDLIGFLTPENNPFYLVDTDNERRTKIALSDADDDMAEGLEFIIGEKNKLGLRMLDGYWEDYAATTVSNMLLSSQSLAVNNLGKFNAFAVIRLTPVSPNPEFLVRNTTTGAQFTITANTFAPGTLFEVNAVTGDVSLDDGITVTDQSFAMADGSGLIQLVPGINQLTYESGFGGINMDVLFRRRYAF